jgi:hypothetical protein
MFGLKFIKEVDSQYGHSPVEIYNTDKGFEVYGHGQLPYKTGIMETELDAEIARMDKLTADYLTACKTGDFTTVKKLMNS